MTSPFRSIARSSEISRRARRSATLSILTRSVGGRVTHACALLPFDCQFYNNLQSHLAKLSDDAKQWVWARRSDLTALSNALNNAHLAAQQAPPPQPSPAPAAPSHPPAGSFQLPHPSSGQWSSQLPPPPPPAQSASSPMPYARVRGPASETASDVTITASPRRSDRQRKGGGVV